MSWIPTTDDVLDAMKKGWPIADDAMNRWLFELKQDAFDEGYKAGKRDERQFIIDWLEKDLVSADKWIEEHEGQYTLQDYIANDARIEMSQAILDTLKEWPIASDTD